MEILVKVVLLVVGFVMLIKGADWFVEGASKVADKFGIPQLVIGLTIVAFGTSAPEAAVSISAALKGSESVNIAIGNVVGSNIINVLVILGITAIIIPLAVQKSTLCYEIPGVIAISILLPVLGYFDGTLSRVDGIILWIGMIAYLVYLLIMAKKGVAPTEEVEEAKESDNIFKLIVLILIGGALIIFGSDVTVDAACDLAKIFGMSERVIGLTIVALGTSLPELITSITAGIKGKADIAIGNIVGSNLFNILFVLGTAAIVTPIPYAKNFKIDTIIMIVAVVLLLLGVCNKERKLKRPAGGVLLATYIGYLAYILLQ